MSDYVLIPRPSNSGLWRCLSKEQKLQLLQYFCPALSLLSPSKPKCFTLVKTPGEYTVHRCSHNEIFQGATTGIYVAEQRINILCFACSTDFPPEPSQRCNQQLFRNRYNLLVELERLQTSCLCDENKGSGSSGILTPNNQEGRTVTTIVNELHGSLEFQWTAKLS